MLSRAQAQLTESVVLLSLLERAMTMTQSPHNNDLLSALSPPDYGLLGPHFTKVELDTRQQCEAPNKPIEYVYFPERGIVSIVAKSHHEQAEAAIVGREDDWNPSHFG